MDAIKMLESFTYVIEHNPNCRSPYLVRLEGLSAGVLDGLCPAKTKDILGYGRTFEKAAAKALKKEETLRSRVRVRAGRKRK